MAESTSEGESEPKAINEKIERTLAIIKPDGMKFRDKILKRIRDEGFHILQTRIVKLSLEQSSEFYNARYKDQFYPEMVVALTEGPIQAMCIAKENAIESWKTLMGPSNVQEAKKSHPNSLRSLFCETNSEFQNVLHGTETKDEATTEIHFFFPNMLLEPAFEKPHQHRYLQGAVNPILWEGLYQVAKQKPDEPITWLAQWLSENNPYKPVSLPPSSKVLEQDEIVDAEDGLSNFKCPNCSEITKLTHAPDENEHDENVIRSINSLALGDDMSFKCSECNSEISVTDDQI